LVQKEEGLDFEGSQRKRPLGTRWGGSFSVQSSTKHGYAGVCMYDEMKTNKEDLVVIVKSFTKCPNNA
jgi:hypothetical protein